MVDSHKTWVIVTFSLLFLGGISLIFFSNETIIGKAVFQAPLDGNAGISVVGEIDSGSITRAPVMVNLPARKKSVAVSFELDYDPDFFEITCENIYDRMDEQFIIEGLNPPSIRSSSCNPGRITFDYVGVCLDSSCSNKIRDPQIIAHLNIKFLQELDDLERISFTKFDVYELGTGIDLISGNGEAQLDYTIIFNEFLIQMGLIYDQVVARGSWNVLLISKANFLLRDI